MMMGGSSDGVVLWVERRQNGDVIEWWRECPRLKRSFIAVEGGSPVYPHCFNGWLERETGYGPIDRLADVLRVVSGALFLRSSGSIHRC
jgi:hypothetical protein